MKIVNKVGKQSARHGKKSSRRSKNIIDMRPGVTDEAMLKKRVKHRADNMKSPKRSARQTPTAPNKATRNRKR